jgi:uncharacterized membrane protein
MPINIFSTIDDPLAPSITEAHGINDSGLVAGSFFDASNHQHGFLLSGSTFTTIDVTFPGATATEALGVNNAGTVVGVFRDASGLHGFMRFSRSGVTGRFDGPAGTTDTVLRGINDIGSMSGVTAMPAAPTASSGPATPTCSSP